MAIRLVTALGPGDGPEDRRATLTLAQAYSQMNRPEEARRLFAGLIENDPSPQTPDDRSYAAGRALDEMDGATAALTSAGHRRRAEIYQFYRDTLAKDGWAPDYGNHGWDNKEPQMLALFIANGPAFERGKRIPTFDNVDVYALLRDVLGLPPKPGVDGTDAPFAGLWSPPGK